MSSRSAEADVTAGGEGVELIRFCLRTKGGGACEGYLVACRLGRPALSSLETLRNPEGFPVWLRRLLQARSAHSTAADLAY